ncbi:MAG: glycosyltransferase [Oscillospiraceae bacterium]|nr:glycosyltransferase [Oscillospiraceae bacterium]
MKKNLTIIVSHLKSGGLERVAARLTHIMKDEYKIKVILLDDRNMEYELACEHRGINIYSNSNVIVNTINTIRRIMRARKIKKEWNTDICLSFGPTSDRVNVFSKRKEKVFVSIRSYKTLESPDKLMKLKSNITYAKAHGVICVSKKIIKRAKDLYPKHMGKFTLLYNPYDINKIDALKSNEFEFYRSLFNNNKMVVAVGNYAHRKGYWHLVKAFSLVKKNITDAKLFIMGGQSNSKDKNNLSNLVLNLKLSDDVILAEFDKEPYKYMSRSSVYVLSSVFEGFPNALAEAMACGVSVIAADCNSGPREMLSEGNPFEVATEIEYQDYGILVPPMTIEEDYNFSHIEECDKKLARAIELILSDSDLASDYAKKALVGVKRFSELAFAEKLINIIEE